MQVLAALNQEAVALFLGIAAGVRASTKGGTTIQVMVRAEWYALLFAIVSHLGTVILSSILRSFHLGFAGYFALTLFFNLTFFVIRPGQKCPAC
jgi:hypothetical protein